MITEEQWKTLTESKFWKPEQGKEYRVKMANWRAEKHQFPDQPEKLALVFDVNAIDGVELLPVKEFSTSGQNLCKMLMHSIRLAEREGRKELYLVIYRIDKKNYNVADLHLVSTAIGGK